MELITCVPSSESFHLVCCGVLREEKIICSLLKNSPPDCFYLAALGTVAFKSG